MSSLSKLSKFQRSHLVSTFKSYLKPSQRRISSSTLRNHPNRTSRFISKPRIYNKFNHSNLIISITYNQRSHINWKPFSKDASKDSKNEILDHNQQRSTDHKQEIISNEYPDLNAVKHPNTNTNTQSSSTAADHMEDIEDDEDGDDHYYVDRTRPKFEEYVLPHPIWSEEQLANITITHKKPERLADYMAYLSVLALRTTWDLSTGYLLGRRLGLFKFSSRMWLLRVTFLETVAGVPGMMFGMVRHLNSLRRLERDRGWINSLLAEAENERIHLLTAMYLYKPTTLMRYAIVIAQGIMCNFLFVAYLLSPRYCHSFVGYLEEQAVQTYTNLVQDIDDGKYPEFEEKCSNLAKAYWKIPADKATWRTVFANIRADESKHRDVNHELADIADDIRAVNPYRNEYKH